MSAITVDDVEEALSNVTRHSGATRVKVEVMQTHSELRLTVEDNGRGIRDADRLAENAYGLIGMKERAAGMGAVLSIDGASGRGTTVTVEVAG